jgi:hypothetical protein
MDEPAFMGVLKSQGGLANEVAGLGYRRWALLPNQLREVDTLDVFHDEEVVAVDFAGVERMDDVGMRQLGGGVDFAVESANGVRVAQPFLADELQGDNLAELPVARLEDLPHAAFAQPLQNDVGTQDQVLAVPQEELVGLIRGEPTPLHELPGQGFRVGEAGLETAGNLR